jgi:alanine-glyoxylate transaminase/serine-glyoxylate transaminase/serine-pyruvate transaminase
MTDHRPGRHFLQIPGPTNVPDRILRAMDAPTLDHRGPEFAELNSEVLEAVKPVWGASGPVVIYPSSGTGAWEAALVNTLSPGDRVLAFETGHFATLWRDMAQRLGLRVEWVPGNWRRGASSAAAEELLRGDSGHTIRAVMVVHNETSTGVTSRVGEIRAAMDAAEHPALLLVDTISSQGSIPFHQDEWGVDVAVGCSQKGLMLPPGLGFNVLSEKALRAARTATLPKSYWEWGPWLEAGAHGYTPSTPATNLLYGLREAIRMLEEEGLAAVFARHERHAEATRRAVRAWGLEVLCEDPREYSPVLTAILLPEGHDADEVRRVILERFDMSLGAGLGRLKGRVFRIGHLGDFNDLTLAGTLCGVEMGLGLAGVTIERGGVDAALEFLEETGNGHAPAPSHEEMEHAAAEPAV